MAAGGGGGGGGGGGDQLPAAQLVACRQRLNHRSRAASAVLPWPVAERLRSTAPARAVPDADQARSRRRCRCRHVDTAQETHPASQAAECTRLHRDTADPALGHGGEAASTWSPDPQVAEEAPSRAAVGGWQSAVGSQQSTVGTKQSAVSSQQSAVSSQQPAASSRQPAVGSLRPRASRRG